MKLNEPIETKPVSDEDSALLIGRKGKGDVVVIALPESNVTINSR